MNAPIPNKRKAGRTAALLGAAVFLIAAAAVRAARPQAAGGPSFLKGQVVDFSGRGAGPEERFAAARASGDGTFFVAALFPAAHKIHHGRGLVSEPFSVLTDGDQVEIVPKSGSGRSVREAGDSGKPAPAAWLLFCKGESGTVLDAMILDPDRTYEFAGAPVYWLGSLTGGESLAFIDARLRAAADPENRKKALFLISCHADPRACDLLLGTALDDRDPEVRKDAVFWLGNIDDARGLAGLKEVFRRDLDPDVREQVVFALSLREEKEAVSELIRLAREEEADVREKAVFWLGQKATAECVKALGDIVQSPTEEDRLKEQAVFAVSQMPREKSIPMLLDIAKTHRSAAVRKQAMFWLGESGDPAALKLFEEILLKK